MNNWHIMNWTNVTQIMLEPNSTTEAYFQKSTSNFNWWRFLITNLQVLFGTTAFIGNTLIATIVFKYPSLRKDEDAVPNIGFLALADGTIGVGIVVSTVHLFWTELYSIPCTRAEAMGFRSLAIFGSFLSQSTIAFVGFDRLTAVKEPFKYLTKDHFKLALRYFLGTTLFSFFSVAIMFTGDLTIQMPYCGLSASASKLYLNYIGSFSIFIASVVIVIYCAMVFTLRKKTKVVGNGESGVTAQLERQVRVTKSVTFVLGIYIAVWVCPAFVYAFSRVLKPNKSFALFMVDVIGVGTSASAASNIFVYSFKMPIFRKHLKKFFKRENNVVIVL